MAPDFEDKCLICLKTGGNLNIFTTYNINNDKEELYVDVIKNCFNIQITLDSGLNAMCNECSTKLRRAYAFKYDILEAVNRLVVLQVVDVSANEKEYSQLENLENQFENDYDINAVLNPETGQISYTLDKINDNKGATHNEPDTYLIDLDNDVIITKKEAVNKRVTKTKRKNDDVVKENLPNNIENKGIKVKQNEVRAKKQVIHKESTGNVILPDTGVTKGKTKKPAKSRSKKIITIDGDLVNVPAEQDESDKIPKKVKAAKKPAFTLEPGQTKCALCSTQFETNKALNTHMNAHFPDYVCNECGMAFATQSRLRAHSYQAHVEGPMNCKYCDKTFTNVNTRSAHMWRVHTKTDPFKCAQCGERFKTYLKRLRHVQSVHGDTVGYPCQYCDKTFAYAAYRTKHVRTIHLQSRPHKCPSCPYSFARRRELDAHRASKHGDGDLKYQCDACAKKFFFRSALKVHVAMHNRHTCNQCDAKFTHPRELEAHLRSHEPPLDMQELPIMDPELQFDVFSDYTLDWVLGP